MEHCTMPPTLIYARDVIKEIEALAPPTLSEKWDNSGLQVGDPSGKVERVLVALTPLAEVFDEAEENVANFVLFHHPLIFGGLDSVDEGAYPGDLIARAVRASITVYAAHTSYDAAPDGVSVALADALGLRPPRAVVSPAGEIKKLVVFTPQGHVEAVAEALAGSGAGEIGDYTRCAFRAPGTGTFLPGSGSDPHLGDPGKLEYADEIRLETVVPAHLLPGAIAAMKTAHPYEEVAHDIYPVEGHPEGCGYGRCGLLHEPLSATGLRDFTTEKLGFEARLVADPSRGARIEKVAVLGGSGGSFLREVAASGADAYITADLDYHDALLAESLGLVAIDAGHAATELPSLAPLARRLSRGLGLPVEVSRVRR